jgi:hypothetical protein
MNQTICLAGLFSNLLLAPLFPFVYLATWLLMFMGFLGIDGVLLNTSASVISKWDLFLGLCQATLEESLPLMSSLPVNNSAFIVVVYSYLVANLLNNLYLLTKHIPTEANENFA